jgi:hypothetical protein
MLSKELSAIYLGFVPGMKREVCEITGFGSGALAEK